MDNDGDLDVVINNSNESPCIYRNDSIAPRVAVQLKGLFSNTHGIEQRSKSWVGRSPSKARR